MEENKRKNADILCKLNDIVYGTAAQTIKTETFTYLTETLAAYEDYLFWEVDTNGKKIKISAKIETLNAKEHIANIINAILANNEFDLVDKNIFIYLVFAAFETLNLSANASIFDENFEADEIEYILFGGIYTRDVSRILIHNPLSISNQELLENYGKIFMSNFFSHVRDMHNSIYRDGGNGDFIGWTTNLVDTIFDLNTNNININKLLSLSDYYVLIIDENEIEET